MPIPRTCNLLLHPFLPISHSMKPPLHTMLISDWAVQKTTALQFVTLVHTFSFPKIKYFLPQTTSFCFHSHKIFFPYNTQFLCTLGWKEKSAMRHHTAGSSELSDPKTKLASQPCSTKESIRKVITAWRKCVPAATVLYMYLVISHGCRVHSSHHYQKRRILFLASSRTIPWSTSKIVLTS